MKISHKALIIVILCTLCLSFSCSSNRQRATAASSEPKMMNEESSVVPIEMEGGGSLSWEEPLPQENSEND